MSGDQDQRDSVGDPPAQSPAVVIQATDRQADSLELVPVYIQELHAALFETARVAMLLADMSGRVLASNEQARRLLTSSQLLRIENGRLEAVSREHARQLAAMLVGARRRTRIHPFPNKGAMLATFAVAVRQLSDRSPLLLIRIRRPTTPPLQRLGPVAMSFGLTIREARMLRLLVSGQDVKEAAQAMNVSISTARTFVKHIYLKVGVNNRQQIMARVLGFWDFDG